MTDCKKPLQGLKVLDFTRVYSGPYCTMMMGDLGADIIKVERKGVGDDTHYFGPMKNDESGYFTYFNRNKKSLSLDLKAPESIEIIKELAEWADIVVENFSPGVMDRLGIGYEDLKERNPKIIYGSISGFGQTGPYRKKPAYDIVCQAMGGFMALTGEKDGQPLNIDLLYNSDSVTEKSIAEYLQSEYQSIGVSLNIHGEEEQSYRDNMKAGNFDMVFNICWGTPYDPQSSLAAMRAPVYGDYAAQLGLDDKAEIDDAITEILITTDENRRQELYTYVLTHLHEDAVYIPLTYECNKAIYRSDMKGFHFTQTQYEVPFQDFSF